MYCLVVLSFNLKKRCQTIYCHQCLLFGYNIMLLSFIYFDYIAVVYLYCCMFHGLITQKPFSLFYY